MEIDNRTYEIFVMEEAMKEDDPGTPLVCRFEDGSFHEVIGVMPSGGMMTPKGYQRIIARKICRIMAFESLQESVEMYKKIREVKPPVHSGIQGIKPPDEEPVSGNGGAKSA